VKSSALKSQAFTGSCDTPLVTSIHSLFPLNEILHDK